MLIKMMAVAAAVAAAGLTAPMATAAAAPTAAVAQPANAVCTDGGDPTQVTDPIDARIATNGYTVTLRYSRSIRCAWGRITGAPVGSQIWVDRSADGGAHWQPWLGINQVHSGSSNYTTMFNDAGWVMRACGDNGHTGALVLCTPWF